MQLYISWLWEDFAPFFFFTFCFFLMHFCFSSWGRVERLTRRTSREQSRSQTTSLSHRDVPQAPSTGHPPPLSHAPLLWTRVAACDPVSIELWCIKLFVSIKRYFVDFVSLLLHSRTLRDGFRGRWGGALLFSPLSPDYKGRATGWRMETRLQRGTTSCKHIVKVWAD